MTRDTQHVLLVLVGGVLIKIVLDGSYLRYVRPWSATPVLAAGVVLVAVALVALVRDLRSRSPVGDHGHDHHLEGRAGPAAWLMVLPVLVLLLVVPPALGSGVLTGFGARAAPTAAAPADEPLPPGRRRSSACSTSSRGPRRTLADRSPSATSRSRASSRPPPGFRPPVPRGSTSGGW